MMVTASLAVKETVLCEALRPLPDRPKTTKITETKQLLVNTAARSETAGQGPLPGPGPALTGYS